MFNLKESDVNAGSTLHVKIHSGRNLVSSGEHNLAEEFKNPGQENCVSLELVDASNEPAGRVELVLEYIFYSHDWKQQHAANHIQSKFRYYRRKSKGKFNLLVRTPRFQCARCQGYTDAATHCSAGAEDCAAFWYTGSVRENYHGGFRRNAENNAIK